MSEFRKRMNALVPPAPDTEGWVAEVVDRGRRRQRQRRAGVLGAAALLVVGLVFAPQLLRPKEAEVYGSPASPSAATADGRVTPTAPASSLSQPSVTSAPCPADPDSYSDSPTPVTLRPGAVALRWCSGPGSPWMGPYDPPEPLTGARVDAWIKAFNALNPIGRNQACTADASTPGLALLTYADGSTMGVAGMDAGCRTMGGRVGFTEMRQLAIDLIKAQRGPDFKPSTVAFRPCTAFSSVIPADVGKVTQGALCRVGDKTGGRSLDPAVIPALRADLLANMRPASQPDQQDGTFLLLYQDNGEVVGLTFSQQTSRWQLATYRSRLEPPSYAVWTPNATSQAAIDAAQRATTGAGHGPNPCLSGVTRAAERPEPGPVKVWFCSNWRYAPTDPLTTGLDEFVASFDAETDQCSPRPADEAFLVEYADGRALRITLPAASCAKRTTAVRAFVRLLEAQRGPGFQGVPVTIGKLCEHKAAGYLADNVMPMTPRDATVVRFCGNIRAGELTGDQIDGLPLKPAEVTTVINELVARSVKLGAVVDAPKRPVVLVLQRLNGERIWVEADAAGTYYWTAPGDPTLYSWQPSAAVKEILNGYR